MKLIAFNKKTIRDIDPSERTALVRVDFNVPLKKGEVADTFRLEGALPTLGSCLEKGAALVLASHLGRPKGEPEPDYSLRPVAERLQTLLGLPVKFADDCVGETAEKAKAELAPGEVLLLENLRFHAGEKKNDKEFVKELAKGCDLYLTDAFGTLHRAHASVAAVPSVLGGGAAGLLVEKEIQELETEVTCSYSGLQQLLQSRHTIFLFFRSRPPDNLRARRFISSDEEP